VHGLDDRSCLVRHVPGQIGVHHIMSLHRRAQGLRIQYIALDNRDSVRVRIVEPLSAPQVLRQRDV
jgi:hypothetical protein